MWCRAAKVGQDYSSQSGLPCIDFGGFHLWPDNWNTEVSTCSRAHHLRSNLCL